MQHKWKYFIILNNDKLSHNIVECGETVDKELPLCCDFSIAINFDSPEELQKWVKDHTSLSLENGDYHIEGHYLKDNEW